MIRSTTFALCLLAGLTSAQNCRPTITQATTLNRGWFCSTITYTYTVCNPANCVLPIARFCVDFPGGTGQLDGNSIDSPGNWQGSVDGPGNRVCWSAIARASQIQPGQCKTFSITTNCNPNRIEGIQSADFWAEFGVPIAQRIQTGFVLVGAHRNFVAGDPVAMLGSNYVVHVTNPTDPMGMDFVFASPFRSMTGLQLPGLGELYLDPILILPLGPVQLGPTGQGQLGLPIPPDPSLSGAQLALQALTFSPQAPRLSSDAVVTVR
jgi:hypothetical protein